MRLVRGESCYWAVGTQFVARLPQECVTETGELLPQVAEALTQKESAVTSKSDTYHITVLITTRCNLACAYCFQNAELPAPGQSGIPVRIAPLTIDDDQVASILTFARRKMTELGATKLNLMLFGGEPTMYMDYCLRLLNGCRELGPVQASMVSNGTLLTADSAAELEAAGLGSVQITFDGDIAEHDRSRITIGGRGTFEKIICNLEAASSDTDLVWQLRVNLTRESIKGADTLLDRLASRLDTSKFVIYFALVHDPGIGFLDTVQRSTALAQHVGALYLRAIDAGFTVPTPRVAKCMTCGEFGGASGATINSDGTLYSCWESAGKDGYEVGTIDSGYLPDDVIRPRWVACEYTAANQIDPANEALYRDTVDAIVLDRLYAEGKIISTSNHRTAWTKTA